MATSPFILLSGNLTTNISFQQKGVSTCLHACNVKNNRILNVPCYPHLFDIPVLGLGYFKFGTGVSGIVDWSKLPEGCSISVRGELLEWLGTGVSGIVDWSKLPVGCSISVRGSCLEWIGTGVSGVVDWSKLPVGCSISVRGELPWMAWDRGVRYCGLVQVTCRLFHLCEGGVALNGCWFLSSASPENIGSISCLGLVSWLAHWADLINWTTIYKYVLCSKMCVYTMYCYLAFFIITYYHNQRFL